LKIKMRLYRQHDLDLIGLYINHDFNFRLAAKQAVISHVRKKEYSIAVPEQVLPKKKITKLIQTYINLEDTDEDVMEWLSNIKPGYRNSLIKNIIRGYMDNSNSYLYSNDADIEVGGSIPKASRGKKVSAEKIVARIMETPINNINKETVFKPESQGSTHVEIPKTQVTLPAATIAPVGDDNYKEPIEEKASGSDNSVDLFNMMEDLMGSMM